mmetsp:Transcript_35468/g.56735  ORF Transcript_35468/g.56735 Transcript_35468/m.56735 type:complete len:347 (-) Transcript_35468:126-1166(-)
MSADVVCISDDEDEVVCLNAHVPMRKKAKVAGQECGLAESEKLARELWTKERQALVKEDSRLAAELTESQQSGQKDNTRECLDKSLDLKPWLQKCIESNPASQFKLATAAVNLLHIHQGDSWSCGYRNLQMLCCSIFSSKLPISKQLFDGKCIVPSITSLQEWIEKAWSDGFDLIGANQYGHKLYKRTGKTAWIGATEITALLRSFRLRVEIIDFQGPHAGKALCRFAVQYFTNGWGAIPGEVYTSEGGDILPLYFQYEGHSMLIIGVECRNGLHDILLIVQDPVVKTKKVVHALRAKSGWQRFMRRTQEWLVKRDEYELVVLHPSKIVSDRKEFNTSKVMVGRRI